MTGGLSATGVVLTLASRPVLGQAIDPCPSATASVTHASHHPVMDPACELNQPNTNPVSPLDPLKTDPLDPPAWAPDTGSRSRFPWDRQK